MTSKGPYQILRGILAQSERTHKPRTNGLTIMLDKGIGVHAIEDLASVGGEWVDYAKIAWGSSLITANLEAKVEAYRRHGITPLLGGTLFEYAYIRGSVENLLAFASETKIHVEISDGVANIPREDKLKWIERFASRVEVFSEIGRKIGVEDKPWSVLMQEDRAAGAKKIVVEGREIGPVGQDIRTDFVDELLTLVSAEDLVFEALERKQQVWLIKHIGPNVNLANILPPDVMTLESFRQRLKEHTLI